MLLDGYWKTDLKSIIRQLKRWSGKLCVLSQNFAEHKVNQGLLYSAVIIRKIVEDERDAKPYFDEQHTAERYFKTLFYDVPATKYIHTGDDKFFMNSKLFLDDYNTKNAEPITLPLPQICNQLIHSYVWGVVHDSNDKRIHGVMVASDKLKEKETLLLRIDDWITAIQFVIDNSTI